MTVEQTYERTMKAEGQEATSTFERQQYSLSNERINEIFERNFEIAQRKGLDEDQTLDSFVVALIDEGVDNWEAEEIAEMHSRTAGEFFTQQDDPDMPPDEFDDDEFGEDDEDDDGSDRTEIFEV